MSIARRQRHRRLPERCLTERSRSRLQALAQAKTRLRSLQNGKPGSRSSSPMLRRRASVHAAALPERKLAGESLSTRSRPSRTRMKSRCAIRLRRGEPASMAWARTPALRSNIRPIHRPPSARLPRPQRPRPSLRRSQATARQGGAPNRPTRRWSASLKLWRGARPSRGSRRPDVASRCAHSSFHVVLANGGISVGVRTADVPALAQQGHCPGR